VVFNIQIIYERNQKAPNKKGAQGAAGAAGAN